MKKKLLILLTMLMLICSVSFAAPAVNKWELLEGDEPEYKIYFDTETVHVEADGTVFFWLKYVTTDKEILESYRREIIDFVQREGNDPAIVSDKIYCVYQVNADFTKQQYELLQHYWYNLADDSFVTSYVSDGGWAYLEPDSQMYKNFEYIKSKATNK